jgi:hypothetical protein
LPTVVAAISIANSVFGVRVGAVFSAENFKIAETRSKPRRVDRVAGHYSPSQ